MNVIRVLVAAICFATTAQAGLIEYVKKPDNSFQWKLKETKEAPSGKSYHIEMVSQTWQGIKWEHSLVIYLPEGVKPSDGMMIYNTGGNPNALNAVLGFEICKKAQIPVAMLFNIPKQPLFEGKKEDALIAETFIRYLKTEDEDWPLLFPMVKSLVRSMDTIQEFAKKEWSTEIKNFVVSGASKRGWTTWLTGASDSRVKAIIPMVIDTLNFQKQIPHQLASFGKPSEMIHDYTERGLVPIPETGPAEKLWKMVDPWIYRDKITMPKMIINGANDPYWSQDALNLYWDDLKGDKYVLYVPNAGHGLEQDYGDGKRDRVRAISTMACFARHQLLNKPMPKIAWKHEDAGDKVKITVNGGSTPKSCRLWVADAPTRDFRKSRWTEKTLTFADDKSIGEVEKPKTGWRTLFAENEYEIDGQTYFLSTQVKMVEAGK